MPNADTSGKPLVSIVTACYNSAGSLEQALLSVQRQTYPNIEHIVVDGGSRDGTAAILERHAGRLAACISEPDRGIADAWNKGLRRARGRLVGTLNADDLYDPRSVEEAVAAMDASGRSLTYGRVRFFDKDPSAVLSESAKDFDPALLAYGFGFMHTSCFVPKAVYDEVGEFDTRYRIAIDTDFLLRCHFRGIAFRRAGNLTYMRIGGISQRRQSRAYMEFLTQLFRQGYPRRKILKAFLGHWRDRALGRLHDPGRPAS